MILECLYIFSVERDHQLSTYAAGGEWGGGHPKCVQLRTGTEGLTPHVYVRTYTIFFMFSEAFLSYSFLFYLQKFYLTFIQKGHVRERRLFFSNKINFCRHETSWPKPF